MTDIAFLCSVFFVFSLLNSFKEASEIYGPLVLIFANDLADFFHRWSVYVSPNITL